MTVPHSGRAEAAEAAEALATPRTAARRPSPWHGQGPVVAVVAVGGGIGATARYGASLLWPTEATGFPWTTFWVNVVGCFVIGLFMVVITDVWAAHRLVRPFFGTGVLGGFTTFSTYAVDIRNLVGEGHPRTALAYLAATLVAALAAVWLAATTARLTLARRRR
ncbi:fluoride efflux transporter CrcB [Streptomyces sp. JV178]|uniref:fluoride efflux transporter CrcB n=1 Tax=Streptomyces sp. JV178 TaxID=858632 RepID=UPI000C1B5345|nr:fluoride efflux transporter CrcB [Streptomyces sp. JV178]PIM66606.1 fluoride efflux transporter CrcB [Streptomyces sp. JV178]